MPRPREAGKDEFCYLRVILSSVNILLHLSSFSYQNKALVNLMPVGFLIELRITIGI